MAGHVAIVIISHSPLVAEGAADMVREMVGDEVRVAFCGGNPGGGLGTDVAAIKAAIERVYTPAGVALLVDLGGAETNSEMAIELLPETWQERVVICNAPIVVHAPHRSGEKQAFAQGVEQRGSRGELELAGFLTSPRSRA